MPDRDRGDKSAAEAAEAGSVGELSSMAPGEVRNTAVVGSAVSVVQAHTITGGIHYHHQPEPPAQPTYIAEVGPELAEWLAQLKGPEGITDLGDGRARFTEAAVEYLRHVQSPLALLVEVKDDDLYLDLNVYPLKRER